MGKADDTRELLSDTMKELFPLRIEINRRHQEKLQKLAKQRGKSVKELVDEALERYLKDEDSK